MLLLCPVYVTFVLKCQLIFQYISQIKSEQNVQTKKIEIFQMSPSKIKLFQPNVPFLNPLKTSENLWFSDIFRGYRNETLGENGVKLQTEDQVSMSFEIKVILRGVFWTL